MSEPKLKTPSAFVEELVQTSGLSPIFARSIRKRALERMAGDDEPPSSSGEGGEGGEGGAPAAAVARAESRPGEHT